MGFLAGMSVVRPAGYTLDADGSNEGIDFGNNVFGERTQAFSVAYWGKGLDVFGHPFSKQNTSGNVGPSMFHTSPAGTVQFALQGSPAGANALIVKSTSAVITSSTKWFHVCWTYSGNSLASGVILYVNGAAAAMTTTQNNLSATVVTTASLFMFQRAGSAGYFDATMARVGYWDRVLTASEVLEVYGGRTFTSYKDLANSSANLKWYVPILSTDTTSAVADTSGSGFNGTPANFESGDFVQIRLPVLAA